MIVGPEASAVMARLESYAELGDGAAIASCGAALADAGVCHDTSVAVTFADEFASGVAAAQQMHESIGIA